MKELIFEKNRYEALLCLNSTLPKYVFDMFDDVPIIAADGGVLELQKLGLKADKVIGDLDSINRNEIEKTYSPESIIEIPDQETNDFEKCLIWLLDSNMKNVLILGLHGGLLEHTLNNWSIMMRYGKLMNLCNYENGRFGVPVYESFVMKCRTNEIVSLIPGATVRLTTNDLKWELTNETLKFGSREGARNIAKREQFKIEVIEGSVLMFIDSRLPLSPIFL